MASALRNPGALLIAGALSAGAFLGGCEGGGGGTGDPSIEANPAPLKVVWVDAQRKDAWERNKPIEFRFRREEIEAWMRRAGLEEILVRPNYGWCATGRKPPLP